MNHETFPSSESLQNQRVVVTGGSRGLGLGLVEVLVERGAQVTVVARDSGKLAAIQDRLGVTTVTGDVADVILARRVVREVQPTVLVLNAGATPRMASLEEQTWEDFSVAWETDVKAGLGWMQAALREPLRPGARVLVSSSGAALAGSRLSGGYAGAKRMLWLMADYANDVSAAQKLGVRFQVIVPRQMVGGTGVGQAGAEAYSRGSGMSPAEFLAARFGASLTPRIFGDHVASILTDPTHAGGFAFGLQGEAGITVLEAAA